MPDAKSYKETLNLPKTDFPMKANLSKREPEYLKKWDEAQLYEKILEKNKDNTPFILHDGPPYANSPIHIGTALNKILKDIVNRYKSLLGFRCDYVPGFDCHGLPIELAAMKKLGDKRRSLAPVEIRKQCREHANKYIKIQTEQFKRLGVFGEWENPYITMSFDYEAQIVRELATLYSKKLLYKAKKAIHWCASCETALAEAEIEYKDKTSPSIYVKFEFTKDSLAKLAQKFPSLKGKKVSALIWTTTPWTLPANMGIALHPEFSYVAAASNGEIYILAKDLVDSVKSACKLNELRIIETMKADDLTTLTCQHPFMKRESVIILGDHVTAESGTGCVHTAPGHGVDDYFLGIKYKLDIFSPVDGRGIFTSEVPDYEGQFVFKTNPLIVKRLADSGHLLNHFEISHSYPHCWRCKKPVLFRATEQWFVSMDNQHLRTDALKWIKKSHWIPSWGQRRIESMMESRPDWCVSRQRTWGVPIPALHCKKCAHVFSSEAFMKDMADHFEKEGGDYWFTQAVKDLIPKGTTCTKCGCKEFEKELDILDVWFDSGCSFSAVLDKRKNLSVPADLYLEGSDQHRGWFHTSLLVAAGTRHIAPYKSVLTHGFVVDANGRKMSKSLGNVVEPEKVINQHGAEILRLWVASENYHSDVPCSPELLKRCSDVYRKIRNTCKFMLGNLYDFDPNKDAVAFENLLGVDQYALIQLQRFLEQSKKAFDHYEFQNFFYTLNNYCIVDLSAFYLDIIKDRLYTFGKESTERRAAQTVVHQILITLIRVFAPVLIFTSEEVYHYMPGKKKDSIHLLNWPESQTYPKQEELSKRWEKLLELRQAVSKALEEQRKNKTIGNALEAKVTLHLSDTWKKILDSSKVDLSQLFIVSQVDIKKADTLKVEVAQSDGQKCPRCWVWSVIDSSQEVCQKCQKALA